MRKHKWRDDEHEISYWQSLADVLAGALLIFILVASIVAFNNTGKKETQLTGYESNAVNGNGLRDGSGTVSATPAPTPTVTPAPTRAASGGGGGGEAGSPTPRPEATPVAEMINDAAVRLQLVDGSTKEHLTSAGVTFALYKASGTLVTLQSYYPENVTYKSFYTSQGGYFYLPQRIEKGRYFFREMSAVTGYALGQDYFFDVDQGYAWQSPLTILFPVYEKQDVIQIHLADGESGAPLTNVRLAVIASEDIATAGGTVRVKRGDAVDEIKTDDNGDAKSALLYYGAYELRQQTVLRYYAAMDPVTVSLNGENSGRRIELTNVKTRVTVQVRDELYPDVMLSDVTFALSASDGSDSRMLTTTDGLAEIDNINQSTTYLLTQTSAPKDYYILKSESSFTVDSNGRVNGQQAATIQVDNRKIRVAVLAQDMLLPLKMNDTELTLKNGDQTIPCDWVRTDGYIIAEGLAPGAYRLESESGFPLADSQMDIHVTNDKGLQVYTYRLFTWIDAAVVAIAVLIPMAVVIAILTKRRKKNP
ncbi:MAG: SpaA isopeptide-forming pilin-related protein [Aliarcobacter cryaerophilus]|nr:SpaA isopeptide-forming pilin-related protein [Aliarcobacter cryaerophilus]